MKPVAQGVLEFSWNPWYYPGMAAAAVKSRLREARERRGLTQQQLAEMAGTSQPQIDRLETGKRRLTIDWVVRLAPLLGVTPVDLNQVELTRVELVEGVGARALDRAVARPAPELERVLARPRRGPARELEFSPQIPIRSAARGGTGQEMFLQDGPIGYTGRPNSLRGVREAYALYMTGDSMEPRYRSGWLLHVNPFKPVVRGRDVVIHRKDSAVLIKEFVRRDEHHTYVRQLNPQQDITFANADILETHLIVGSDQEG
jgi:phage repressor protein C with HTH and peptisase S24 domain